MTKTEIVERLGQSAVLLPGLIAEALVANDRLKLRFSLLQAAADQAAHPGRPASGFDRELRDCGLDAPELQTFAASVRALDGARFSAPGLGALVQGIKTDLALMMAPLRAAVIPDLDALVARAEALIAACPDGQDDAISTHEIAALTSARRERHDSLHLLVMDLHRALNRLAAETAVETIDGARAHHLEPADRERVRAFMSGLNRTAPLAFGHPGLGTTAARVGPRLMIQNDIGETDAHVLVMTIEGLELSITYTDVHRRRARFFMGLFAGRIDWTPLAEQAADGLGDSSLFYLVTGRGKAVDLAALDDLLAFVGSRIVFLIDWNKARKALQTFVSRDAAIGVLAWAASHDLGHRAFIELGGAELVFEAIRRAAGGQVPYGAKLSVVLGEGETADFLRQALRVTSEGLAGGRSDRLVRDEIQADLAQRFETAERAVLALVVRHLGLSRTLAAAAADLLAPGPAPPAAAQARLAARARLLEAKADRLTLQARELCARLQHPDALRRAVDAVEDAMDALDQCAFLISLAPGLPTPMARPLALAQLADLVVRGVSCLVSASEASARLPGGRRSDADEALQGLDGAAQAERQADLAERAAVTALMGEAQPDPRALTLGLEITRALEDASDHVAHAALAMRQRVLEALSA